jgi:hypothetical protein
MTALSQSDRSPNTFEGHAALALFQLAPDRIHLNHGSYGAVPKSVVAEQDRLRALIERDPTGFFNDVLPGELRRLAGVAASRFGGTATEWVFCENATSAVSSVLSSLDLRTGDEILTSSHAYGAVLKATSVFATRTGASLSVADVPATVESEDQIGLALPGGGYRVPRFVGWLGLDGPKPSAGGGRGRFSCRRLGRAGQRAAGDATGDGRC